jgi:flagellar biosynthesis/type III secretory pathway chaperone
MIPDWQHLVDALREELKEYGAMRTILDDQQKAIFARDGVKANELNGALNVQIELAAALRDERIKLTRQLAEYHELPVDTPISQMKTVFPEAAQGLLKALIGEINSMLAILRRRSRQNQLLLARTCDVMEQTLRLLRPEGVVKTYSQRGSITVRMGAPAGSRMQTTG